MLSDDFGEDDVGDRGDEDVRIICSGLFSPNNPRLLHNGAAVLGLSIQNVGLFHCLNESNGMNRTA